MVTAPEHLQILLVQFEDQTETLHAFEFFFSGIHKFHLSMSEINAQVLFT